MLPTLLRLSIELFKRFERFELFEPRSFKPLTNVRRLVQTDARSESGSQTDRNRRLYGRFVHAREFSWDPVLSKTRVDRIFRGSVGRALAQCENRCADF